MTEAMHRISVPANVSGASAHRTPLSARVKAVALFVILTTLLVIYSLPSVGVILTSLKSNAEIGGKEFGTCLIPSASRISAMRGSMGMLENISPTR